MDFRRADPNYVNFVPKTCADAIDLFTRHRNLGLTADLYPECFVHCARQLPDEELDNFHSFIVNPSGDIAKGGERPTAVDAQLEKERKQLLQESKLRDSLQLLTITEEKAMSVDEDEKSPTKEMSEEEKEDEMSVEEHLLERGEVLRSHPIMETPPSLSMGGSACYLDSPMVTPSER